MKTNLGISVGLLGAAVYFLGLVGGWLPVILIAGYVLLFETNEWLRKSSIKAVAICIFFAVLSAIVGFVPDAFTLINNVANIFEENVHVAVISNIVALINTILFIIEKVLLLLLGFKALHQGTVGFGIIDRLVEKHTPKDSE